MSLYTEVLSGVKLPTVSPDGCQITWDIGANHTGNLANNTLVNNTNEDISVTLFATITDGVNSEELTYQVTIQPNNEDTELMEYYSSIEDVTGEALKLQLRSLITSTHTHKTSYDELKDVLQEADEDPNNSNNMILFYTGESVKKSADMNVWNREHVWAQSLSWFNDKPSSSAYSDDLFQVAINANKTEIKAAVEEIFGVKVAKVNTVRMQGKVKRTGAYPAGRRAAYKKAVVTLTADSKTIEFFEGMV